jgi:hypothetical protein
MSKRVSDLPMVPALATDRPKARVQRKVGSSSRPAIAPTVPRFTPEQRRQLLDELRSEMRVDLLERLALPAVRPLRSHERDDPRGPTPAVLAELASLKATVCTTLDAVSRVLHDVEVRRYGTERAEGPIDRVVERPEVDQADILRHLRALLDETELDGPDHAADALPVPNRLDGVSPLERAREALIVLEALTEATVNRFKDAGQRRRRAAPEPIIAIWRAVQEGQKPDAAGRRPKPVIPFENGLGSKFPVIVAVCFERWGYRHDFNHSRAIEAARRLLDEDALRP